MDETRRTEAQKEIGKRHPYLTVYGRRAGVTVVLAVGGFGLWWADAIGALVPAAVAALLAAAGVVAWVLR